MLCLWQPVKLISLVRDVQSRGTIARSANEGIAEWPIYPNHVPQCRADRESRQEKVQLSRYRYVNSKVIRYLARPPSPDPVLRAGRTMTRSGEGRRILNGESPVGERDRAWKKFALSQHFYAATWENCSGTRICRRSQSSDNLSKFTTSQYIPPQIFA